MDIYDNGTSTSNSISNSSYHNNSSSSSNINNTNSGYYRSANSSSSSMHGTHSHSHSGVSGGSLMHPSHSSNSLDLNMSADMLVSDADAMLLDELDPTFSETAAVFDSSSDILGGSEQQLELQRQIHMQAMAAAAAASGGHHLPLHAYNPWATAAVPSGSSSSGGNVYMHSLADPIRLPPPPPPSHSPEGSNTSSSGRNTSSSKAKKRRKR
jgi:hypothetical protein